MENIILTPELIEKAKQAASTEELIAIAKEKGIELSQTDAERYFKCLNTQGELSDDELNDVSGGGCRKVPTGFCRCGGMIVYGYRWDIRKNVWFCNRCNSIYG